MKTTFLGVLRAPAGALALAFALLAGCGGGGDSAAPAQAVQNTAPVAKLLLAGQLTSAAGTGDAATYIGAEVKFDASGSTDVEGDALTFAWTLTTRPAGSAAVIKGTGAVVAVTPDVAGTYAATVRITDSKGAFTDKVANLVVSANAAPVASVAISATFTAVTSTAASKNVTVGASILLDGSGSADADGDPVTTSWELIGRPAASIATLTTSGKTARLSTDVAGTYKVRARGTDPTGAYSETIYPFEAVGTAPQVVVVSTINNGPVDGGSSVVAGTIGYVISLSNSTNYPTLSNAWTLVSKPAGSAASLSASTASFTQVTPDVMGDYVVKLVATAPDGVASSYTTTVSVANRQPLAAISANAIPVALPSGPTLRLPVGTALTLRGTGSSDADGDALTYLWSLDGKPAASATTLSATDQSTVQLTTDKAGSYVVSLRVTDKFGAYSVQTMTIASGNAAPVAVLNTGRISTIAGTVASLNAIYSFDDDGDALTYSWALDAKPAASTATISGSAAQLAFTPDVAGTYVASVTVSDGKVNSVAYVTIVALSSTTTTTSLPFTPLLSRYSKGLDRYVAVSTGPDLLNIVDPFTGTLRQIPLPAPAKSMNISQDGKLAVVLHDGTASVVDLQGATLVRSSATGGTQTEAFITNAGLVYMMGSSANYSYTSQVSVLNGRTGADLTSTLGSKSDGYIYGTATGVYSPLKHKGFVVSANSTNEIYSFSISSDIASSLVSTGYRYDYTSALPFFLSASEDLLFTGTGNYFRTDTLKYAGKLAVTNSLVSVSQSDSADEAIAMGYTTGTYDFNTGTYGRVYESSYHRFTGALFYAAADVTLPVIGSAQSYGIGIYHSANNNHIALVQTGSATAGDAGLKYYLVTR